jgi:polysaccharide biosynthesis transport protein
MEERSFHPLDYVAVLRRRKWWFIVPFALSIVIGSVLAMVLPRQYKSSAEIGIADATLSPELLRGVQSVDARERQRAISQQLLSRSVLERVVREEKLSPNRPTEEVAASLRARIEKNIEVPNPIGVGKNGPKDGVESFRLGYVDSTPERAQRISNRLAAVFVEENSRTTTQRAENTSEVLGQQVRDSQERLNRIQEQLRSKKETFMGKLPDQTNSNVLTVNGLRQQLESLSTQLAGETQRLSQVESMLDTMVGGAGNAGMTAAGAAAIQSGEARLRTLQQALVTAKAQGFTDLHPEIVRIREEIAEAQKESSVARQANPSPREEQLLADPIYRQKADERNLLKIRITQLRNAETQARTQIAEYQRRVDAAPMVEQELSPLVQEYDLERARFGDLSKQYQNAQVAEDLARKQGGERFVVLNPAYLPTQPDTPDIFRVLALSLALGFMLGSAAIVGREFMDRSVHDVRALQTEFEIPVLGEIPKIHAI